MVKAKNGNKTVKKTINSGYSSVIVARSLGSIGTIYIKDQSFDEITLRWDSVIGVKKYRLYRNGSLYQTLNSNILEFNDKQINQGTLYSYYIVAVSGKVSTNNSNTVYYKSIAKGNINSVSFSSVDKILLSWNSLNGVDGYQVQQRINGGSWKDCYKGNATSYTISNADMNNEYSFRVRGYCFLNNQTVYGSYSTTKTADLGSNISVPICSLNLYAYDSYVIGDISSVNNAFSYECVYSTNKNNSYKTAYSGSSTSFTINNLTNGTTYYFKIRIIMTVNGQRYVGNYSSVMAITPRAHYIGAFEDMVDLGTMFNSSPTYKDSEKYWYDYNSLIKKDSSFIEKYKTAMREAGATCSVSSNHKKITFDIDGDKYYLEIINSGNTVSIHR